MKSSSHLGGKYGSLMPWKFETKLNRITYNENAKDIWSILYAYIGFNTLIYFISIISLINHLHLHTKYKRKMCYNLKVP